MKRLFQLEQRIGQYGEQLLAKKKAAPQNQWIVNEIRTILDDRMSEHSSKPELKKHFTELFSGLETLADPAVHPESRALAPEHSEAQILARFDQAYFHGNATFEFAAKVLADRRVRDVDHLVRAVVQGGTILRAWTGAQRELFQLHAANKLWRLGQRSAARDKLRTDYEAFWSERLRARAPALAAETLRPLARALSVTQAVGIPEVVARADSNWRSLYVVWTQCVLAGTSAIQSPDIEVADAALWQALRHLGARYGPRLPAELSVVPSSVADAPRQVRNALLRRAQTDRDGTLLDLLLASSSSDDKIGEAGILAAKLALA